MGNCLSVQTESDVRSGDINCLSGTLTCENDTKTQPQPDSLSKQLNPASTLTVSGTCLTQGK